MTIPDVTEPTASHLGGIQPTWGDLPFACDLSQALYRNPDADGTEILARFETDASEVKTDQMANFLRKLGILSQRPSLLPNGIFLAELYEEPSQVTFGTGIEPGVKGELVRREQVFWKTILFERNWVPMLATLNLIATRNIESAETVSRAEAFKRRVNHIAEYQSYNSINTWKKKAQAHFEWFKHTGLVTEEKSGDRLSLTKAGETLHDRVRTEYHPDWPAAIRE